MFIRTYRILLAVLLCAAAFVPLSPGLAHPAAAAPDDVPNPVATGLIEEWSVGAGLVYWGDNCFADEFNPYANLYRKPSGGGTQRTLAAISDGNCITFRNQLAAADGLYYFSLSFNRIERMPLAEPFTPQAVKVLTGAQQPTSSRGFFDAGGYLYWPGSSNIFRTRKDGSGAVETVANTAASANDVVVVGATVYWSDSTGIWTTTTNCDTLPCTGSQQQFASLGPTV